MTPKSKTGKKSAGRPRKDNARLVKTDGRNQPEQDQEGAIGEMCSVRQFPLLMARAQAVREGAVKNDDPREASIKTLIWLDSFTAELEKLNVVDAQVSLVLPPPSTVQKARKRPVPTSAIRETVDKKLKPIISKTQKKGLANSKASDVVLSAAKKVLAPAKTRTGSAANVSQAKPVDAASVEDSSSPEDDIPETCSPVPTGRPRRKAAEAAAKRMTRGNQTGSKAANQTMSKAKKTAQPKRRTKRTPQASSVEETVSLDSDVVVIEQIAVVSSDTEILVVNEKVITKVKHVEDKSDGDRLSNSSKSVPSSKGNRNNFFGDRSMLSPVQRLQDDTFSSARFSTGPVTSTPNSHDSTVVDGSPGLQRPLRISRSGQLPAANSDDLTVVGLRPPSARSSRNGQETVITRPNNIKFLEKSGSSSVKIAEMDSPVSSENDFQTAYSVLFSAPRSEVPMEKPCSSKRKSPLPSVATEEHLILAEADDTEVAQEDKGTAGGNLVISNPMEISVDNNSAEPQDALDNAMDVDFVAADVPAQPAIHRINRTFAVDHVNAPPVVPAEHVAALANSSFTAQPTAVIPVASTSQTAAVIPVASTSHPAADLATTTFVLKSPVKNEMVIQSVDEKEDEIESSLDESMAALTLEPQTPAIHPVPVSEAKNSAGSKLSDFRYKTSSATKNQVPARTLSPPKVQRLFVNTAKVAKSASQTDLPKPPPIPTATPHIPNATAARAEMARIKTQGSAQSSDKFKSGKPDGPPSTSKPSSASRPPVFHKPVPGSTEKNSAIAKKLVFGSAQPPGIGASGAPSVPKTVTKPGPFLKNAQAIFSTPVLPSVKATPTPVLHSSVNPKGLEMGKKIINEQREAKKISAAKTAPGTSGAVPSLDNLGSAAFSASAKPGVTSTGLVRAPKIGNLAEGATTSTVDAPSTHNGTAASSSRPHLPEVPVQKSSSARPSQSVTTSLAEKKYVKNDSGFTQLAAKHNDPGVLAAKQEERDVYTDYGLDIAEDDDTDDEEQPRKDIPSWARSVNFTQRIRRQLMTSVDLDKLFEGARPEEKVELTRIFKQSHDRYKRRNSSQVWPHGVLPLGMSTPHAATDEV